jgi:hypothetical protein
MLVLFYLVGAGLWFCIAGGLIPYEPWFVTLSFILLGVQCITSAMKSVIE